MSRTIIITLIVFLLPFASVRGQQKNDDIIPADAEFPFKRDIEKGKYDKADEKIKRRISRDTANLECHYAAYWLYSTEQFARRNLDTAYRHLICVRTLYAKANEKELERWARDSYSGARIDYDIYRLGCMAIADAHRLRTPDAFQHIIDTYTLLPYPLRDSATNSRDSLEFLIASRSESVATLQHFIDLRPNALVRKDAVLLRDSLAFASANQLHTYAAYQQFRVSYPNSHLYHRATDSVYAIDYRQALYHNTEQYYRSYADRYPDSPHAPRCLWLADSIEYHREVDSTQWQSYVHYLDTRHRRHWEDTALTSLTLYALRHQHLPAAHQAALRFQHLNPMRQQLADMLHHAYLHTSILNFNRLYHSPLSYLIDNQRRLSDSLALQHYLSVSSPDSLIQLLAPCREAFTLLQQQLKPLLDSHRWAAALNLANTHAHRFNNDYQYRQLLTAIDTKEMPPIPHLKEEPLSFVTGITTLSDTMLCAEGTIMLYAVKSHTTHEVDSSLNIYISFLDTIKGWGQPIELGPIVNTPFDERCPYLMPDMRTLLFSSDGHGSLGLMDIYVTYRLGEGWEQWSTPVNLGRKVNTSGNDWVFQKKKPKAK
ncbi:MAG: PD40 domain-containing protein [Bacteroidales bacterium]|nr:PD40 domain-containing protein [Bacteroidales bacterium]